MKISVIIPVYNTEEYLDKCILSIIDQDIFNQGLIEIVLVNDGSTDNSGTICDSYAQQHNNVKVIHKMNEGVSKARNTGIENATGDIFTFVDSDDFVYPDLYSYSLRIFALKSEIDILFYSLNEIKGIQKTKDNLKIIDSTTAIDELLEFKLPSSLWLGFYKRHLFKHNLLDESIHFYEDIEFQIRLIHKSSTICHSKYCFYHYLDRDGSANNLPMVNDKVLSCMNITRKEAVKKIISKSQLDELNAFLSTQVMFYGLKSERYFKTKSKEVRSIIKGNLLNILKSKRLKLSYKVISIMCLLSTRISYTLINPYYKKLISKI